jgi:hypothetical protein
MTTNSVTLSLPNRVSAFTRTRRLRESPLRQGAQEQIPYRFFTTLWGTNPNEDTVTAVVTDESGNDVTSSKMPGDVIVSGDLIILPALVSLAAGTKYRIDVRFTCTGTYTGEASTKYAVYFEVVGEA